MEGTNTPNNNQQQSEMEEKAMDTADGREISNTQRLQGSPLPPTVDTGQEPLQKERGENEEEEEEEEDDDIETFTGKIVYNPDGSAYIIEGSEVSDVESELGGTILKEGGIIDDGSKVTLQSGNSSSTHLPSPSGGSSSATTSAASVAGQRGSSLSGAGAGHHYCGITVPIPKVVAAHHIAADPSRIASSLSQSMAGLSSGGSNGNHGKKSNLQSKVPDVPIMHSYRVYTLRDGQKSTTSSILSGDPSSTSNPNTSTTAPGDSPSLDEDVPSSGQTSSASSVPVKPILMCFICKISFGYTKSFVTHATSEHNLDLVEEESKLLGQKNVSAIIQGVGKDKEPLLSFLEPKNQTPLKRATSNLLSTVQNLTSPPSSQQPKEQQLSQSSPPAPSSSPASRATATVTSPTTPSAASIGNPLNVVSTNCGNLSGNSSNSNNNPGDLHQQFQQQLMAMQVAALAAMRSSSATGTPLTASGGQVSSSVTSSSSSASASSAQQQFLNSLTALTASSSTAGPNVMDALLNTTSTKESSNQSRPSSNGSLNLVMPKNNSSSPSNLQDEEGDEKDQQDCSELADLANLEKIAKAAAAAIQSQQAEFESQQQQMAASFGAAGSSPPSSQSPNSQMSTATGPMSLMAMVTASPKGSVGQQHPSQQSPFQTGMPDSHMTMMHSRNSCKTLKCPKCNWHYKYQETLEIHMKEKHPENEMNCIYCLTNQAHPRLARGETYTCGYKPYRCEVCNYSTTTKGNLSIHMQSDKHINNVQELQNGGQIAGMTSLPGQQQNQPSAEQMLQTQALAQAVALANAANNNTSGGNNLPGSNKQVNVTGATGQNVVGPSGSSNASSPGLNLSSMVQQSSSGEKVGPINTVPMSSGICPSPNNPQSGGGGSAASGKPKATWRCDVCNYETGVARNLRIHMTSEKHTHNMVVLQQSVKHYQVMQQQAGLMAAMSGAGGADPMLAAAAAQMHPGILAALAAAAAASASGSGSSPVPSLPSPNHSDFVGGPGGHSSSNNTPEAALADMAYNQAVMIMQQQQRRAMAMMQGGSPQGSKSPFGAPNPPMIDMEHPDPSFRYDSVPYDEHSRTYQCCVCTVHTCDSVEALSQHIQSDRTRIREDEVTMSMGASGGNVSVCKMCSYKTNLKANFQLHCKTDKHLQRLQQVNHIKEGGSRTEWKLKYVNVSNPIQVRCNLCDYYTNSIHKLQVHSSNPRHETSARVFVHLQLSETILRSSQRDNGRDKTYYYNCSLCNYAARTKIGLVHHFNSPGHSGAEMQRQQSRSMAGVQQNKSLEEEIREVIQVKELSPGESINFSDNELLQNKQQHNNHSSPSSSSSISRRPSSPTATIHTNVHSPIGSIEDLSMSGPAQQQSGHQSPSPHSRPSSASAAMNASLPPGMDPMLAAALNFENSFLKHALQEQERQQNIQNSPRSHFESPSSASGASCPFCNYTCSSDVKMQLHVLTQHANKQQERAPPKQRLLCPLCQEGFEERIRLETHLMDVHNVTREGVERLLSIVDTSPLEAPENKKRKMMNDDEPTQEDGRSDTSSTDGREESIEQTAARFLKLGGGVPLAAVSDRHVYKYRCQQCSLAFKTKEKLQLHSQYHLIRAATQCVLCNRSFRSVEALQRHVETSHRDMTDNEVESYRASLANNPFLGRNGTGILDPSTTELLLKESNRGNDVDNDEDAAMDLAMSSLEQSIEQDQEASGMNDSEGGAGGHNSLEDYLNSQAIAEDSYNDPSRKYKCHRCKVAFTRQSYLTAHNKTLLHRKGEKVDYPMEKYLDPNRPFKCEICKESFTQKNILLVHYNSVSHLHRQKQLKMKEGSSIDSRNQLNINDRQQTNDVHSMSGPSALSPNESGNNLLFPPPASSPSSSVGDNSGEKKPFKCNICRVSYNLSSSLDIHIRSVLHQSRASKINELILSGQIDLSIPFIERGEEVPQGKDMKTSPPKDAQTPFGMSELQLQQQLQQQLALAAMAQAAQQGNNNSGPASGGVYPCGRCGALFPSQDICMQHSQLCSLFGPPMINDGQRGIVPMIPSGNTAASAGVVGNKFYSAPTHRTKPPIYKHLLETFGFEIVMQFNEHHQRRKKMKSVESNNEGNANTEADGSKDKDNNTIESGKEGTDGTDNESLSHVKISATANESSTSVGKEMNEVMDMSTGESSKKDSEKNCPEINRSTCNVCFKEFSSVWVLKAHKEEVHKEVVPFNVLESFAEEYRKEFEKKQQKSESNNEDPPITEVSTVSRNRPTPSQTPGDHGPPSAHPSHSTPVLPHPSGGQQNIHDSPPNPMAMEEGGMNPAAAQLAAQMQFSQLLMSMGLAGMAVPGMVNNPFAAAAAMGIPPQMIPLMMASGHLDPMMAAFNHQAAAAAQGLPHTGPSPVPVGPSVAGGPSPGPMGPNDPMASFAAQQQKILAQQQMAAAAAAQQGKRARTRITDEQLKILRQYFDINNSPSEEALAEMSEKSGLPLKVIKHWFRNTLFKERQRNKDSPYNFNNPPSTFLNLEEYEKTGEAKILPISDGGDAILSDKALSIPTPGVSAGSAPSVTAGKVAPVPIPNEIKINHAQTSGNEFMDKMRESVSTPKMSAGIGNRASGQHLVKTEEMSSDDDNGAAGHRVNVSSRTSSIDNRGGEQQTSASGQESSAPPSAAGTQQQSSAPGSLRESFDYAKSFSMSPHSESSMSSISTNDTASQNGGPDGGHGQHNLSRHNLLSQQAAQQQAMFAGLPAFAAAAGLPSSLGNPLAMAIDAAQRSQSVNSSQGGNSQSTPQSNRGGGSQNDAHGSSPGSNSGPGKRANRTRFTDYQIKVLQEFFESNAYPKDDDLEYLSKLLNLSPRVIVVWFQNARQKARKVYENQPAAPEDETSQGRFQRTPGLNYQCKKCQQVFQRYYELIKHQKSACFKDENPLSAHLRAAAEARREAGSTSPGAVSASNMSNHSSNTPTPDKASSPSANAFRCEKCPLVFSRFDLWREHQIVHIMNPNLFPNAYPPSSPFGILQFEGQNAASATTANSSPLSANQRTMDGVLASIMSQAAAANNAQSAIAAVTPPSSQKKSAQKVNNNNSLPLPLPPPPSMDDDDSLESFSGQGSQTGSLTDRNNSEAQRDKRLRTTILPEQLDYLYQKYQLESNPSRKMLENIAKEVGLKKRVVQVWFQNTRARERKGQFRAHQQVIHKRCPFCRALFKARSALESHLATRHADQYTKGDINIDALPDGEPDDMPQTPFGLMAANMSINDQDNNSKSDLSPGDVQAKQAWEKYMEKFAAAAGDMPPELALTMRAALGGRLPGEMGATTSPLDLSKPVDLTRSFGAFGAAFATTDGNGYDSHSDGDESDRSDMEDNDDGGLDSPTGGPGSANSSITGASPAAVGNMARHSTSSNSNNNNNNNKRFRTQMTTVQLKVMKSIFADYKTPSMAECDSLGRDIGLPKRVIQVWFQNARAKEKKAKLNFAKSFGHEMPDTPRSFEGCKVCNVRYNADVSSTAMQDHLFSKAHLDNLRSHIDSTKKSGSGGGNESADESVDYPAASMIVMPNNVHGLGSGGSGPPSGDEAPNINDGAIPSQSVNNLMQLMGLAFSSASSVPGMDNNNVTDVSGLNPVNGGSRTGFMGANSFMANHQQFKQPNL